MAREDPQIKLRLSEELRDAIRDVADANGRSMNAEIVHRLEQSLQAVQLAAQLDAEVQRLKAELESIARTPESYLPPERTLYVLLDADGLPLSWQEIMAHLAEIQKSADLDIQKIDVRVIDAHKAGNSEREKEFFDLLQKYRTDKHKRKGLEFDYLLDQEDGLKSIPVEVKKLDRPRQKK